MARYKHIDTSPRFLAVDLERQLLPGTFEHALNHLFDHEMDLSGFDAKYGNDETGAAAYSPAMPLKVVLFAYSQCIVNSRAIERACREHITFIALSPATASHTSPPWVKGGCNQSFLHDRHSSRPSKEIFFALVAYCQRGHGLAVFDFKQRHITVCANGHDKQLSRLKLPMSAPSPQFSPGAPYPTFPRRREKGRTRRAIFNPCGRGNERIATRV